MLGAEVELWNGSRARSWSTSDAIYPNAIVALAAADEWIIRQTDGLLDPAIFAMTTSRDSERSTD